MPIHLFHGDIHIPGSNYVGIFGSAHQHSEIQKTMDAYLLYSVRNVEMLMKSGITPVLVFDGGKLKAKDKVSTLREERRQKYLDRGMQLQKEGKAEANKYLIRAIPVTHDVKHRLQQLCREIGIGKCGAPRPLFILLFLIFVWESKESLAIIDNLKLMGDCNCKSQTMRALTGSPLYALCVPLFLFLSLSLCLCLSPLCLSVFLSLLSLAFSLSLSSHSVSLSLSLCLSSLTFCLCLSLSLCLSVSPLCLSLSASVSLCLSISPLSLFLPLSISVSLSLPPFLSFSFSAEFIVAPYEADAQMAYLALRGHVDAVLSDDSDLLVFGAPVLIMKLRSDGCVGCVSSFPGGNGDVCGGGGGGLLSSSTTILSYGKYIDLLLLLSF